MPRSNFQFKIIDMEKFRLKEDFEEGWTTPQGGYLRSFLTEKSALPLKQILQCVWYSRAKGGDIDFWHRCSEKLQMTQ